MKFIKTVAITTILFTFLLFSVFLYKSSQVVVIIYEGNSHFIIEDQEVFYEDGYRLVDDILVLSLDFIKDKIDPYIHWDEAERTVTVTTRDKTIRLKTESLTAMINMEPVDLTLPANIYDGKLYLPIDFLSDFFRINVKMSPNRDKVIIDFHDTFMYRGTISSLPSKVAIKAEPSIWSKNVEIITNEDQFIVFDYDDEWFKVRTMMGNVGFIRKNLVVTNPYVPEKPKEILEENIPWSPEIGKINMVWDYQTRSRRADLREPTITGLDVISPTWFHLKDSKGNINNLGDINYVEWAHNNGYQVWVLFSNNFDPDMTSEFLNSTNAREKAIKQLLVLSQLYKIDGINIDFENMYQRDRDMFTQFVREMVPVLREQGLIISVDVTVRSQSPMWSLCYDRKALGEIVDYVAVMTYDEHWAASPVSGPVASFGWVERGIRTTLEEVPPEKVLLGIPFYARVWEEKLVEGKIKVTSKAYGMSGIRRIIGENNVQLVWDEGAGTYYGSYKEGDSYFRIWVEDSRSIELKLTLVEKYNLAGVASWRKGFESQEIWELLNRKLKEKYR